MNECFDAGSFTAQFDRVALALADKLPEAAGHLDEARDDLLAFSAFPGEIWTNTRLLRRWIESRATCRIAELVRRVG